MSAHCEPSSPPAATIEPQGTLLVAFVGRPNAGKSSLFNRVTGGDAHVGNFPGVTVDILEASAVLPGGMPATIADLPGLYSIEATVDAATDEGVARAFIDRALADARPTVVVQVLDATQLALGLRLTRELLRLEAPLLVVATQRDLLEAEGRRLDERALSEELGVPVIGVSAREPATRARVLAAIEDLARGEMTERPALAEGAPTAIARRVISDAGSADARARRRRTQTARVDALLLHPAVGPVVFLGLMAAVFSLVFLIADPVTTALDAGVSLTGAFLTRVIGPGMLESFITDGLLGGAGTVLAFMPQIVILTVAMELLDATGYLARGAFLVDRVLRVLGLSGRSFVPLLMAHACAVPAIGATRVVRDPRERLTTILVLPLMTCSARLPTYALLIGTFFSGFGAFRKALIFISLYAASIVASLIASLVLRKTVTRGRSLPLVLEMPAYRAPEAHVIGRKALQAAGRFTKDVGTTILAASAVLWILLSVPVSRAPATPQESAAVAEEPAIDRSLAAALGRALEPVTAPIGFDWKINVGLIASFGARELMVGTLGVIFGMEGAEEDPGPLAGRLRDAKRPNGAPAYTARTGIALLAFFVLACQCLSTLAAIRRETRSWRWPAFVLGYTYALAYGSALLAYHVAGLVGVS